MKNQSLTLKTKNQWWLRNSLNGSRLHHPTIPFACQGNSWNGHLGICGEPHDARLNRITNDHKIGRFVPCHQGHINSVSFAVMVHAQRKHISQPDLTEVRFGGATNMWKKMWKKTRLKVQEICWTCRWEYTFLWFGKGGHIFFVSFVCVCDVEGMTCLVYTHYESLWKRHGGIGVVNFLCLVQDLFLIQKLAASHLKTRASEDPITSYGTGKAFYTFYTYGRCSAHQFRLADVPRRSP